MNSYFVSHPEMVLGEMKMESTRFGMDSACKAYPDMPLAGLLHEAMQRIDGEIPEIENNSPNGMLPSTTSKWLSGSFVSSNPSMAMLAFW